MIDPPGPRVVGQKKLANVRSESPPRRSRARVGERSKVASSGKAGMETRPSPDWAPEAAMRQVAVSGALNVQSLPVAEKTRGRSFMGSR